MYLFILERLMFYARTRLKLTICYKRVADVNTQKYVNYWYNSIMISRQYIEQISLRREIIDSFDRYPFCLPTIHSLNHFKVHPKVTFFVGENGSGKSTLLEAIAVSMGFNSEGGSKNFNFSTYDSHSNLSSFLRIAKGLKRPKDSFFLRAESFFNVATEIQRLDEAPGGPPIVNSYGGRSLHEQSHGESFITLLMNRFREEGLYLLDEPEAALSPQRQLVALARIHELVQSGSQFIIATHSPILMAYPDATIYLFGKDGISQVKYKETEHYQITQSFLNNPERMLNHLLKDTD